MTATHHIIATLAATLTVVTMSCYGTSEQMSPERALPQVAGVDRPATTVHTTEPDFDWVFTGVIEDENPIDEGDEPIEVGEDTPRSSKPMVVREIFAARSIVNRHPMGIGIHFRAAGQKVWAYTKVQNRNEPSSVTMVWRRNGVHRKSVKVGVGHGDTWRTWTSQRMEPGDEGSWTVEVRDPSGRVLDRTEFEVDPRPSQVSPDTRPQTVATIAQVRRDKTPR